MARSRRKDADDRRKEEVRAERRGQVRGILVALGLWEKLSTMKLGERMLQGYYPRVEVIWADDVEPSDETASLLREMEKAVKRATFDCPLLGKFLVNDYFSFVYPVLDILDIVPLVDPKVRAFVEEARARTEELASPKTEELAMDALYRPLHIILTEIGRLDRHLFYVVVEQDRKANLKWFVKLVIHRENAQIKIVTTQTGSRQAFRCGAPFSLHSIPWIKWPASLLGSGGAQSHYPVYVQRHALDNLYTRAVLFEKMEWILHDCIWRSLEEPKLTPLSRSPGKFLAEYILEPYKLGYFVVQQLDDIVLVETFLFLTMNGTPEGDAIWEKLRLRRQDKEYLRLDQIDYFLRTDVRQDPVLVAILKECGCGHLFEVLDLPEHERLVPGYAKDLRSYLGLDG